MQSSISETSQLMVAREINTRKGQSFLMLWTAVRDSSHCAWKQWITCYCW